MLFSTDTKKALQNAIDDAVRFCESAKRDERDDVRKLLLDGIEALKFVEILCDDRQASDMVTLDGPEVRVRSEPVLANLPNKFRDLLLARN
jgi:hypothetical protein